MVYLMKKIVLLFIMLLLVSSCANIKSLNYDEIISSVVTSKYNIINQNKTGYKYYIPSGMSSISSTDYNEIISSANYNYYLYVDVVSYYNRVIMEYNHDDNAYLSVPINYEDKYGYLEVNKQSNDKYLIEIMYNYAKIEVMVDEIDLKSAITNSMIILSSINYNNEILASIIGNNVLEVNEESFNIFQVKKKDRNSLDVYEEEIKKIKKDKDPDLIN